MSETSAERWAGKAGDNWNTYLDQFEGMLNAVGKAAIDSARFAAGEHVLDIGSGGGASSLMIAQVLGESGHLTGLDLSTTLVTTASRRAKAMGLDNIAFKQGDAGSIVFDSEPFDRVFSRFGVMFFEEPYTAFKHIHSFIKPGGRLNFACWGPTYSNPWIMQVMGITGKFVDLPPANPKAPGPFAFGDKDYVEDILSKAGFSALQFDEWQGDLQIGGPGASPEVAARFMMDALFVGEALKNESDAVKAAAFKELCLFFKDYHNDAGVSMQGHAWLVSAHS